MLHNVVAFWNLSFTDFNYRLFGQCFLQKRRVKYFFNSKNDTDSMNNYYNATGHQVATGGCTPEWK